MLLASRNGLLEWIDTHSAWYRRGKAAMVIHACVGQLIVLGVGESHEWEVIASESLQSTTKTIRHFRPKNLNLGINHQ